MAVESKWLIRSSGRISGPFSSEEVPQLLKSREVQLRDEISAPYSRWITIESHPDFHEAVETFKRHVMSENTEVSLTPAARTQTVTDIVEHDQPELTEEITDDLGFTATAEIVVENLKEEKTLNPKDIYSAQYQLQGLKNNPVHARKVKETSAWIQIGTLLVVIGLGVGFFFWNQSQRSPIARMSEKDFKSRILSEIELGNYPSALEMMKTRSMQSNFIDDYGIYYALLLLQIDQQSLLARRALDQLLATQPQLAGRTLTGLGLTYLVDGQWAKGLEYFAQALQADSTFSPARSNQIIASSLSKDKNFLDELVVTSAFPTEDEALVTASLFAFETGDLKYIEPALARLGTYIQSRHAYLLEASVLKALMDSHLGQHPVTGATLLSFWDTDPQYLSDHRYNAFVFRHHLRWSNLYSICMSLITGAEASLEKSLTEAACNFHAQNYTKARSIVEQLIDQHPKNALIQAWYAMVLKATGAPDQASVALGRATELNRKEFRLPLILQARFCEAAGDRGCAMEAWKTLMEIDYNNLTAIAGMARINFQNGSIEEGQRLVHRGAAISPDYKPILLLKSQYPSSP